MAIHIEAQTQIDNGFEKKIEQSSMGMMLDVLQKYQYQYPIRSVIRELVSNGLDSISERESARSILENKSKVEDHYAEIEGEMYADSHFKPEYYDLAHFSHDEFVHIWYFEGGNSEKDYIEISDNGVGLGGSRLQKYFNLGYSTKRLNKSALGKFGLGNKSPLSVMSYYTVESRYNGKLFRFNVYSGRAESLIPEFNLETGERNEFLLFNEGTPQQYPVYYLKTTYKNGLTVRIEAKKHHRQQYVEAVKSQLLYFSNIDMTIVREDSNKEKVDYKANIFYEDEHIILSDNNYWSKPHLLINKVNYGFIDFSELELEQKNGNIGIKVEPELLDINPSRESVLWTEKTKQMVQDKFALVVSKATILVQEELNEFDFMKWVKICYQISARYQKNYNGSVLSRLANIIDLNEVKPYFPGNKLVKFTPTTLFEGFKCRYISQTTVTKNSKHIKKVEREELKSGIGSYIHLPIFLVDERASVRTDKYLLTLYPEGFVTIKPPFWLSGTGELAKEEFEAKLKEELDLDSSSKSLEKYEKLVPISKIIWGELQNSSSVLQYADVVVPDSFKATDQDEEEEIVTEEEAESSQAARLTHEERRKLEGKVVIHTPRLIKQTPYRIPDEGVKLFDWQKLEVPVQEINDWDQEEIYYGSDIDSSLIQFASAISAPNAGNPLRDGRTDSWFSTQRAKNGSDYAEKYRAYEQDAKRCLFYFDNPQLKIIKVAQSAVRLYRDFKHIKQFFLDIQNKTITMSNVLIKWNTARQMRPLMHKLNFLYNFPFVPEKAKQYRKFLEYVTANGKVLETSGKFIGLTAQSHGDLIAHIEKVQSFQMFVSSCDDAEQISELAKEMWGNNQVQNGHAIDLKLWNEFKELVDWAESVHSMLNAIPVLTRHQVLARHQVDSPISDTLHQEIMAYLQWKNVS